MTTESLPPLKSSAGRSSSAATSRMTWIDSASSASSWDSLLPPSLTHCRMPLGSLPHEPTSCLRLGTSVIVM